MGKPKISPKQKDRILKEMHRQIDTDDIESAPQGAGFTVTTIMGGDGMRCALSLRNTATWRWAMKRAGLGIALISALVTLLPEPAHASRLDVERRLDLRAVVGETDAAWRPRALAHDGKYLWLLAPDGATLLALDPGDGSLRKRIPLRGGAQVNAADMAFGAGDLWLADPAGQRVLRVSRNGLVRDVVDLPGRAVGVDFVPERQRSGTLEVAVRGRTQAADRLLRFSVRNRRIRPLDAVALRVPDGSARASMVLAGARVTWVAAPRLHTEQLTGDPPGGLGEVPVDAVRVPPPDDTIPRGGEDLASTHQLALIDAESGSRVTELYLHDPLTGGVAASDETLFATEGLEMAVAVVPEVWPITYGAEVCRRIEFFYEHDYEGEVDDASVEFANPWDETLCDGPLCAGIERQATAGYLAQGTATLIDEAPFTSTAGPFTYAVGSGSLVRYGRQFFYGNDVTGIMWALHEVRATLRDGHYTVLPSAVGPLDWVPPDVLDLYTYDGNDDDEGDDNPATDIDDYYTLDSAVVRDALIDSGALAHAGNAYHATRSILHYVKRRHVYSGWDGGWTEPAHKLTSPYASCSSSAFMVAAMAREMGIPARLVGTTLQRDPVAGGAVSRDEFFHRWAQVFLPGYGWVRVDATPIGPIAMGYTDVNGDGIYDNCDRCTTNAQCQADFDLSFADCDITTPFTNANDVTGDGIVNGDDVEIIGAEEYTIAVLDKGLYPGISDHDFVTWVAPGVRTDEQDPLRLHYVSNLRDDGDSTGETTRWVDWRACIEFVGVSATPSAVTWRVDGDLARDDRVRLDLYQLTGDPRVPRYRHRLLLAADVPAHKGHHPIDLRGVEGDGPHVIVVTRQGGRHRDQLTRFAAADWETFGASEPFLLSDR